MLSIHAKNDKNVKHVVNGSLGICYQSQEGNFPCLQNMVVLSTKSSLESDASN